MSVVFFTTFTRLCNNPPYLIPEYFYYPKRNPIPFSSHSPFFPFPSSWQTIIYFLLLWICLFWTFHVNVVMQYVVLCDRLLSLSIMLSRFIQCCSICQDFISILWSNHIPLYGYATFCLPICLLVDIWVVFIFWIL